MISALTPEYLAVSPGMGAFVTFFVLAIAMVLLVMNMSKHLRKIDHRRIEDEVRAEFAAEQEEQAAGSGDQTAPDAGTAAGTDRQAQAEGSAPANDTESQDV